MSVVIFDRPQQHNQPVPFPSDLTGLQTWFKADSESYADAATVGTVTDRSGNSRNATQATGTKQPTFHTGILNGLPVYRFDGVDDFVATATFTLAQPLTRFTVIARTGNNGATVYYGDGSTVNTMGLYKSSGQVWNLFAGASLADGAADTSFHVIVGVFNGSSSIIRVDGGAGTTGNAGTGTPNGVTLGAAATGLVPGACDVAEQLVYNSALSASDVNRVGRDLAAKYRRYWKTAT